MAAGALAIANLIAELLPSAVNLYKEIAASAQGSTLPPVETILAQADANWDTVANTAKQQLGQSPPAPPAGA